MPRRDPHCTIARTWWSANLDGEAVEDAASRAHLVGCVDCVSWMAVLERLPSAATPATTRQDSWTMGDPLRRALAEWDRPLGATARDDGTSRRVGAAGVGIALLWIAGLSGLVLSGSGLVQTWADGVSAGVHTSRELYAFETALSLGFILTARHPGRYARALFPMVAAVSVLIFLPAVSVPGDPLAEASHISVLVGMLGLFVVVDARSARRGGASPALGTA